MKYHKELLAIEEQSIRLECLTSLVNVIANGVDNSSREEVTNTIWHISGALEDINTKLKQAFSECFDSVREDEFGTLHQIAEPGCGGNCDSCKCNDEPRATEYKFDELQSVVNGWIRNNPAQ